MFGFVGVGGPGGGFGAPGGGFSGSRSSGKPLLLLRLKKPPPGAPKPPPGPPKPKKTKQKTEQKNKKTLFRSDPAQTIRSVAQSYSDFFGFFKIFKPSFSHLAEGFG